MRRRFWAGAAVAALIGVCGAASAQETAPADGQGVIVYDQAFFASARPTTALDMIARLPGFVFDDPDNARGFNGTAGNVLINGDRPVTKTESLEAVLRRIAADGVERVELIRGGAPGIDMQGRAVLANVVLKTAARTEKVINYDAYLYPDGYVGLVPSFNISRRQGVNETELNGRLFWDRTDNTLDGLKTIDFANGAQQRALLDMHDHVYGGELRGAVQRPILGGKVRVNGVVGIDDYDRSVATKVYAGPGVSDYSTERYRSWSTEAGGRFDRKVGAQTDLEIVALQRFENSEYASAARVSASEFGEDDVSGESILRGVLRTKRGDAWSLEGGLEGAYNFLDSDTRFSVAGAPIALPAASVKVEELRGEAFGTATWRPSAKLTVEAGARIEQSTIRSDGDVDLEKTLVFLKPRVLATWSPTPTSQVRVRLEREVGQLDFHDFVASAALNGAGIQTGNPNLEPQQAWVAELALEQRFWDQGAVIATVRHERLTDVVDRVPVCTDLDGNGCDDLDGDGVPDVFDSPGNIGDGDLTEAALDFSLPLDRFGVPGGLFRTKATYRWSRVTDPTTGVERRISGQHAFDGEMHFTQDLPRWRATWGVDATFGNIARSYRLAQIDTTELGTYLSAYIEFKPRPNLSLRAEVVNLGSRPYTQTYKVYSGPRNTAPVQLVDSREYKTAPGLFLRLRRTFG
jgi:hypothetical protein